MSLTRVMAAPTHTDGTEPSEQTMLTSGLRWWHSHKG
jgi:hypothetical protein